jgi:hypothetical protein
LAALYFSYHKDTSKMICLFSSKIITPMTGRNACIENTLSFLLAIVTTFFIFSVIDDFYGSDFVDYWQGAQSILNQNVYSTHGDPLIADNFRPFGYPLIIAIFYKAFGPDYVYYLIATQSLISVFILRLTFMLLLNLGLYSILNLCLTTLLFFHPTWIFTAAQLQCDIFVSLFITLYLFFIINFYLKNKPYLLYIAIAMLSVSLYFRPSFLYFIPITLLICLKLTNKVSIAIAALIASVIIAPWIVRNKVAIDSYRFASLGSIALSYIASDVIRHAQGLDPSGAYLYVLNNSGLGENFHINKNDQNIYKKLENYSLKVIREHPFAFVTATVRGLARVLTMPHEIYAVKRGSTIPVDQFVNIVKTHPVNLLRHINFYFIYLYIFPLFINLFILLNILALLAKAKRWLTDNKIYLISILPVVAYGWLIPGAINKSHYMTSYYTAIILVVLFALYKMLSFFAPSIEHRRN